MPFLDLKPIRIESEAIVIIGSGFNRISLGYLLACVASVIEPAFSADPPAAREIISAHQRLKASSGSVSGTIKRYRTEEVVSLLSNQDHTKAFSEVDLRVDGSFWRDAGFFRTDFTPLGRPGVIPHVQSYAVDIAAGKTFHYTPILMEPDRATLPIQRNQPNNGIQVSVEIDFLRNIDSLWKLYGEAIADLLQRPGTIVKSVEYDGSSDATLMKVSFDENTESSIVLDSRRNFACRSVRSTTKVGKIQIEQVFEIRLVDAPDILPATILETVEWKGSDGGSYSAFTSFDWEVDQDQRAMFSTGLSEDSFADLKRDIEVFQENDQGGVVITGKVYAADRLGKEKPGSSSVFKVAMIGLWVLTLLTGGAILFIRISRRS